MAKYVVLIPADETAWEATPQAEREQIPSQLHTK